MDLITRAERLDENPDERTRFSLLQQTGHEKTWIKQTAKEEYNQHQIRVSISFEQINIFVLITDVIPIIPKDLCRAMLSCHFRCIIYYLYKIMLFKTVHLSRTLFQCYDSYRESLFFPIEYNILVWPMLCEWNCMKLSLLSLSIPPDYVPSPRNSI